MYSKSPTQKEMSKQTRRIMISLNNSGTKDDQNEVHLSGLVSKSNGRNFATNNKHVGTANKQIQHMKEEESKLESPMKISHSLTQNLSYRMHLGAKSPNNKSAKLMSCRSQNSELSEFYDNYSKNNNSNKDNKK